MLLKSFKIENSFLIEQDQIEFISQIKHSAIIKNNLDIICLQLMRIERERTEIFISLFK